MDKSVWQGRDDIEDGKAGHRWHNCVSSQLDGQVIALHGYCCDKGVAANKGRVGAKSGPDAIRKALANIAWHLQGGVFDAGDTQEHQSLQQTQDQYAKQIASLLGKHQLVIGLGGGHDIAWGSYQGLQQSVGTSSKKVIGIINFDAHFDLRKPAPETSSGTPFYQISEYCNGSGKDFNYACLGIAETANTQALFERADTLEVDYLVDLDCEISKAKELLTSFLQKIDELYVTICLDVFSSDRAPGVSAPSALGISPHFVIDVIHWLAANQQALDYRWRLADIAEMNPEFDIDQRTSKLAARLIHEMCKALLYSTNTPSARGVTNGCENQ